LVLTQGIGIFFMLGIGVTMHRMLHEIDSFKLKCVRCCLLQGSTDSLAAVCLLARCVAGSS
jgi:hypothetical protein